MVLTAVPIAGRAFLGAPAPSGHDAIYYLPRHVEFQRALAEGVIVPRWAPDFAGGLGQPLFEFTPPLFYYLTAAVQELGLGLFAAAALVTLLLLASAGLSMYLLAREFFGPGGGTISAVAYLFAPYLLVTAFVRYAMGDFAAFGFAPLAFWGALRFGLRPSSPALFGGVIGTAALLLTSNHVALMTLPAVGAAVAMAALASKRWKVLAAGAAPLVLGLGTSAFFWLPALAERGSVFIDRAIKGVYEYSFHFVYPQQLVSSPWGYGGSVAGPDDGFSMSLGPLQLILGMVALALTPLLRTTLPLAAVALPTAAGILIGAAFLASDASHSLWTVVPFLPYLQFPWRFLSLGTIAVAFLAGGIGPHLARLGFAAPLAAGVLLAGLTIQGAPNAAPAPLDYDLPETLSAQNVAQWGLRGSNADEFEPIWVQQRPAGPATTPLDVLSGSAQWEPLGLASGERRFSVITNGTARLRLNTFYFPGWRLRVDGTEQPIDFGNSAGLMEFQLHPGGHTVAFSFEDTPLRAAAGALTLISGFATMGAAFLVWRPPLARPH